eukprot:342153_1
MAALNNMNFVFDTQQRTNEINYDYNATNPMNPYPEDAIFDEATEATYGTEHQELSRKEYWKEYELDYTPNIVRWLKSNYLQHMKGEQRAILIGGYNHCGKYYLQTINYGKTANEQSIEVVPDNRITLSSQIADIQFADDATAVIVTRNGEIQLIKLQQNDQYSPRNQNDDDDEKMMRPMEHSTHGNRASDYKWKLVPISSTNDNPIICYPNQSNTQYRAVLTSVTVNTICGNIVASDEGGCIYITDIDQQKSISSQSCSSSAINCIRFANSDTIASVSMSGQLMLWDLRDLNNVCYATTLPRKHGSLISLAVHPHRNHIYSTGTEYGTVAVWDIRGTNQNWNKTQEEQSYRLFAGHCKHTLVNDVQFLTNNANTMNGLVTCGNDGISQIFQSEKDVDWKDLSQNAWNTNIVTIQESKYPVTSLDFYDGIVATCCDAQKLSFFPI